MSILIRNMAIPKSCDDCRLNVDYWCLATIEPNNYNNDVFDYTHKKTKPDWCPLIEVPKHGRLIDADALIKKIDKLRDGRIMPSVGIIILEMIKNAPTVIPAEEGE